jgi:hypothetical protein
MRMYRCRSRPERRKYPITRSAFMSPNSHRVFGQRAGVLDRGGEEVVLQEWPRKLALPVCIIE